MLRYFVLLLLYFAAYVSLNDSLNVIALYGAIPLACLLSFYIGGNSLKSNKYIKLLLLMYLWIAYTSFFAKFPESSSRDLRACLGVVLLSITIANMSLKPKNIPLLYGIYIILFISAIKYALQNIIGIQYNIETDRVNDSKLNANTIAYYTFFLTYTLYILGDIIQKDNLRGLFRLVFLSTIIISIVVALFTASRQVLVIQIPLILILLYIRYWKNATKCQKMLVISISIICFIFASAKVIDMYANSYLGYRSESDAREDVRVKIMETAIKVGCEYPILGVGPANFRHYNPTGHFAHCTYLELFADSGIIAASIFIILLYKFISRQWHYYRLTHKKDYLCFLVFGFIYALDNVFFVFYNAMWLMSFFILVASHSIVYQKMSSRGIRYIR